MSRLVHTSAGGPRLATSPDERKAALLEAAVARVRERFDDAQAEDVERFVRAYYAHVAADDLSDRSDLDLYGAALAHWNLARVRQPGELKVHVYTPNVEEHGWESPHTVVETVVDDMPFLVDSVSMEVTRNGSAIHLVIRPIMRVRRDEEGRLLEVGAEDGLPESLIHVEIDRQADPEELEQLRAGLCRVLGDVRAAVEDWPSMRERVGDVVAELAARRRPSTRTSAPRPATCSSGCTTATSRSSATASTTSSPRTGRTCCAPCPARGSASSARPTSGRSRSASRSCRRRCAGSRARRACST